MVVNLTFIFLSFINHATNLLLRETTLVVSDRNAVGLSGSLVRSRDIQDTVGINVKGNFNLRNTTGSRRNARQLELAKQVVVFGSSTLSFVHLNKYTGLVVSVSGEDFRLFGGNHGVTLDESGHDTPGSLDTGGKRGNVEKKKVLCLLRGVTRKDSSLNCSTIGNSLIRVDALVGLLAVEEVGNKFDDTRDTSGTTDQDDFMDVRLVDLRVAEDLLNRFKSTAEEILAEFFETGASEGSVEIDAIKERVNFDRCLGSRGESTLSALASSAETTNSTRVGGEI